MRVVRQTPAAINKPITILGIDRTTLGLLIILSFLIAAKLSQLLGIALFLAGCLAAKTAFKEDPNFGPILRECWKLKAVYDPIKREPFEMEIE